MEDVKTMTCKDLGGACDMEFRADTFEEIAELSKSHGMEMFQKGDGAHIKAMNGMKKLMGDSESTKKWMESKRQEFEALSEDN